jgi:hypothetical protein
MQKKVRAMPVRDAAWLMCHRLRADAPGDGPVYWAFTVAGKTLLDDMKKRGETLTSKHPKSERVQPCKTQYMRLCKLYVEVMKEHQRAKVRGPRS